MMNYPWFKTDFNKKLVNKRISQLIIQKIHSIKMNSKSQGRSEGPYFGNDFEGDISIRDTESMAY